MQAILVGHRAAELLVRPSYSGSVMAVFSKAIYLSGNDGEILWLAQAELPAHRRCVRVSAQVDGLAPGMRFNAAAGVLNVGDVLLVDLVNVARWRPRQVEPELLPPVQVINEVFWRTLSAIQRLPTVKGLAHTLTFIANPDGEGDYRQVSYAEKYWVELAMPIIRALIAACYAQDLVRILRIGRELIGLGPGLTPSGDDYIGGLLFTAHQLEAAYSLEFIGESERIRDFLNEARLSTNRISHTILSDLADGHGPEPLHDLAHALLQRGTLPDALGSVGRLTQIGHTSGWDMLAGAMTGMLLKEAVAFQNPAFTQRAFRVALHLRE